MLSSLYESKLIAAGYLHRAESVLKFHCAIGSGAHLGGGGRGCCVSGGFQPSIQDKISAFQGSRT